MACLPDIVLITKNYEKDVVKRLKSCWVFSTKLHIQNGPLVYLILSVIFIWSLYALVFHNRCAETHKHGRPQGRARGLLPPPGRPFSVVFRQKVGFTPPPPENFCSPLEKSADAHAHKCVVEFLGVRQNLKISQRECVNSKTYYTWLSWWTLMLSFCVLKVPIGLRTTVLHGKKS